MPLEWLYGKKNKDFGPKNNLDFSEMEKNQKLLKMSRNPIKKNNSTTKMDENSMRKIIKILPEVKIKVFDRF